MNLDLNRDDEPLALEQMSPEARQQTYDRARAAGCDAALLDPLDRAALRDLLEREGIDVQPDQSRQHLQSVLLKHRCARHGLVLTSGVLEVMPDGFGFLRSPRHDYLPGPDDVYLSQGQVHRLALRTGHRIAGPARLPRRGEQFLALLRVESVDGDPLADLRQRVPFDEAAAVLPHRRLPLAAAGALDVRAVELLSPWGHGQRVLVQAPPTSGRTLLLTHLIAAALRGNTELHAIVCLLDERPEDVTEMRRSIDAGDRCQVVATTFDAAPARHLAIADLALAQAQRLVESGRDALLVVDSLTALVRACQHELPHSGRLLTPGLEATAMLRAKRLFAAGRSLDGGAALTVIGTVLTGTDSRIDAIITEEFAGKGNADLVLDRGLAALHVFPALDVLRTGTRREDCLLDNVTSAGLRALRLDVQPLTPRERLEHVLALLAVHGDNERLLRTLAATR